MTLDFQEDVLKYLAQTKEGKSYLPMLDSSIFDLVEHQTFFELLSKYLEKYKTMPSETNMIEYWDRQSKKLKSIEVAVYNQIAATIHTLYVPLITDTGLIRDSLIEQAQYKKAKTLFSNYSGKLKDGIEIFRTVQREMADIVKIGESTVAGMNNRGGLLLEDHALTPVIRRFGKPTYLNGLNKLTSAKGFHAPQLIVIMGAPKAFKTGVVLSIAVNYVRDGLKVYYADTENGIMSIQNRSRQCMLHATLAELLSGDYDPVLEDLVKRYKVMGGDMAIDFYPAYTKTMADVDMELEYLKHERNWVPDLIVHDYLDKMMAIEPMYRKETRINIQHVYFDAINLNNKWGTFAITPSQISKQAVNKAVITKKDFAEDFGKAMNAHAAFAICQTPEEEDMDIARLIPVVQREGVEYKGVNQVMLRFEKERMLVEETDFIGAMQHGNAAQVKGKRKNLKDE